MGRARHRESWRLRQGAASRGPHQVAIDLIGAELPIVELLPLVIPGRRGLLDAVANRDAEAMALVAERIVEDGMVVLTLGAPSSIWPHVQAEAEQLWPSMQPGRLSGHDGSILEGKSPSGATRGDRYVPLSAAAQMRAWPAVAALDRALAVVGCQLSDSLEALVGRRLCTRTDPFLARFPGGGARYGAHLDGGGGASGRLVRSYPARSNDLSARSLPRGPPCHVALSATFQRRCPIVLCLRRP